MTVCHWPGRCYACNALKPLSGAQKGLAAAEKIAQSIARPLDTKSWLIVMYRNDSDFRDSKPELIYIYIFKFTYNHYIDFEGSLVDCEVILKWSNGTGHDGTFFNLQPKVPIFRRNPSRNRRPRPGPSGFPGQLPGCLGDEILSSLCGELFHKCLK